MQQSKSRSTIDILKLMIWDLHANLEDQPSLLPELLHHKQDRGCHQSNRKPTHPSTKNMKITYPSAYLGTQFYAYNATFVHLKCFLDQISVFWNNLKQSVLANCWNFFEIRRYRWQFITHTSTKLLNLGAIGVLKCGKIHSFPVARSQ
jgi:hypothetical protein